MNRKSCFQFNTFRKNVKKGCMLSLKCKDGCEHYERKGGYQHHVTKDDKETMDKISNPVIGSREEREVMEYEKELRVYLRAMRKLHNKEDRKHVAAIAKPTANFCCPNPECRTNLKENLIRLRDGLHQCRLCGEIFMNSDLIDDFDFDDLLDGI